MKVSKKDLTFTDETGKKFTPYIWEISGGIDRTFYVIIDNAYKKEKVKGEKRIVLSLNPKLAPYDTAVLPLVNKNGIPKKSKEISKLLRESNFDIFYDDSGSIGRRYRRLDEIGVKYAITIDYQTLKDSTITIRDRDSMKQIRVKIKGLVETLKNLLEDKIKFEKAGKIIN